VSRPENPKVRAAIIAALSAAHPGCDPAGAEEAAKLSMAWEAAFSKAFDAARPPGRFESWARRSLPRFAACLHRAKLETTSPKRCDAICLSAAAMLEVQQGLHEG
jgi:acyl-CoA reductase-like NAD-dependent aldehyde dehydrogenase